MAGEDFDDYDVEDGLGSFGEGTNDARFALARDTMARTSDAILQAAADRVAQASKGGSYSSSRPRPLKFGATTLLGPKGFRLLREMGERHLQFTDDPVRDLDTLMRLYRDWIQTMYPKFQFRDTVDKIERHCRTAPMKAYLSALWRASEGSAMDRETFDELQYVAERNAQEAMDVLDGMKGTSVPMDGVRAEGEVDPATPSEMMGASHHFGPAGPETTESSLRF